MTELTLPATDLAPDPAAAVAELRRLLPGQVATRTDVDWETLRLGWVLNIDQRPAAVVTVADPEDIVTVVQCAARHRLSVSTQPVGHGATEALTGTVLLRTAGLQELTVDVERRTVRLGAGVKWGAALAAVEPTGLVPLAGSNPDPSVVGFTLGGGLSWFSRAFGIAAHSVVAFEAVDSDGVRRTVTRDDDPDLFWALCGGGGDFAIVTAMELRLFEAGPVHGGRLMWPVEMARPVLQAFREITARAPDELTAWAHLLRFPPDPALPEQLRGRAFVTVDVTYLGSVAEMNQLLSPLRQVPALVADTMAAVPLGELGGIAAEPVEPMPTQEYSELLYDLDEAALDRLVDVAGAGSELPLAVVQLRHLGGELARATSDQGPNGAIRERYQVLCVGVAIPPGARRGNRGRLRRHTVRAQAATERPDLLQLPRSQQRPRALVRRSRDLPTEGDQAHR